MSNCISDCIFLSQYRSSFLGGFLILELQFKTITCSHLNESDFLEKLLLLKEMHSHEPRAREREQRKQSKNVTDPHSGLRISTAKLI